MARVARNGPCPCGSGLKYKRCHEGKDVEKPRSSGFLALVVLAVLIAVGAAAVVIGIARGGSESKSSSRQRVWSEEHKHWHDAPAARSTKGVPFDPRSALPNGPRPAPPGTPPPGKVWSPEHGHWHDAPSSPPIGITYAPAPPG
jgi:SEC-C motif-containing protein